MSELLLIDMCGKVVLRTNYGHMYVPTCGLLACRESNTGCTGFINVLGETVIPFTLASTSGFDLASGVANITALIEMTSLKRSYRVELIDRRGHRLPLPESDAIGYPREGLCYFRVDDQYGFVTPHGHIAISPQFSVAGDFCCGLTYAGLPDRDEFVYINHTGAVRLGPFPGWPGDTNAFTQMGVALVTTSLDRRSKYIDTRGETVLELPADVVGSPFRGPLADALHKPSGSRGYIDTRGRFVIAPRYKSAYSFKNGYTWVTTEDDRTEVLTLDGVTVSIPAEMCANGDPSCGLIIVRTPDSKYGACDLTGRVVIPPRFPPLTQFSEGYAVTLE